MCTRQRLSLLLLTALCLTFGGRSVCAEDIDLTAVPPFLLKGVPPNLVLTLDNSDSMKSTFLPDNLLEYQNNAVFTSPDVNGVYYSPSKTYLPGLDADGQSLGNADFTKAKAYPYLDCKVEKKNVAGEVEKNAEGDPIYVEVIRDLRSKYLVYRWLDYTDTCPDDSSFSINPASAAFYHLYDPDNRYHINWESVPPPAVVCNAVGQGAPDCHRCGDDFVNGPDKDTPDACFDRVLVGGDADLRIAACTDVPDGTAGITAQDTYAVASDYSTPTGLNLTSRMIGETCKVREDDSALGSSAVDVAKTNFANWFSYHRTRLLVAKTALSRVMQTLSGRVRLAYQGMRDYDMWYSDSEGNAFADLANTFDSYSKSKTAFYDWMFGLGTVPDVGSVLGVSHVRAGEFVASDLANFDLPGLASGGMCGLKCRNNFHLMFADGGWEDRWGDREERWPCDPGGSSCWIATNQDGGTNWQLPNNVYGVSSYNPGSAATQVFADDNIGMLADIVFYYWRRDLREDADNEVPRLVTSWDDAESADSGANFWNPRNDPATWQHLSFYAVGMGVNGAVTPSDESPYGTYTIGSVDKTLAVHGFPDANPSPYTDEGLPSTIIPEGPFTAVGAQPTGTIFAGPWWAEAIPEQARIDDFYHATLNGRGRYYNASDAQDLVSSFADVLDTVSSAAEPEASNASVAVNSAQLSTNTLQFQIIVDATHWRGELRAYRVSTGYNQLPCGTEPRGALCESANAPYWSAPQTMAAADRMIVTQAAGRPLLFTDANFDQLTRAQQLGLLGCGPETGAASSVAPAYCGNNVDLATDYPVELQLAKDRINYLRGDADKETGAADGFRERNGHWLGDILGSNALVVTAPKRVFYDTDYVEFRNTATVQARSDMVYVGANDGMLHAFDADSGTELFAYVPEAIYPYLSELTEPGYGEPDDPTAPPKRAFVDGPLVSADATFTDANNVAGWRTVLLGSLGLGAQGVYALDITDPDGVKNTPSDLPLWEFTDASGSDDSNGALDGRDLGYSLAPPAIVRIDNDLTDTTAPTWVALISNGYNNTNKKDELPTTNCTDEDLLGTNCTVSQTGNAVLYVLRLGGADSTRVMARIDTGHGFCQDPRAVSAPLLSGNSCAISARGRTNGLGPVTPVDIDGDLIADLAYAGDLFGNLWRFDLVTLEGADNPRLLFSAKDANGLGQPITSAVVVQRHPTGLGVLVLFGTGQYLNAQDKSDLQEQSFYGIWDDGGLVNGNDGSYVIPSRSDLLQQHFQAEVSVQDAVGGTTVSRGRSSTNRTIDWSNGSRGWFIDLKLEGGDALGERVVLAPQLRGGRVVFVSSIPRDCCSSGGTSWVNALDFKDGSRLPYTPFDYNLDGSFNGDDKLSIVDANNNTSVVVGSSIRILTDGGTGIYSAPTQLGLGGGQLQSIVSDSEGDILLLRESTALDWRNWLQLQ